MNLKQYLFFILLPFILASTFAAGIPTSNMETAAEPRIWCSNKPDSGAVHCLGNGRLCVYEKGPNIFELFGPPYSSPSVLQMGIKTAEALKTISNRIAGTAIWQHQIFSKGRQIGLITDFVDAQVPCLVRRFSLDAPITFSIDFADKSDKPNPYALNPAEAGKIVRNPQQFGKYNVADALLVVMFSGQRIYGVGNHIYPTRDERFYQLIARGQAGFEKIASQQNRQLLHLEPGESVLYICGGPDYPSCIKNAETVLSSQVDELFGRTRQCWRKFTQRRHNFDKLIPREFPKRDKLLRAIDDVAIIIKTQQGAEGGILAGHKYHLAYVRDQYGASRCLLRLGYYDEARAILEHDWSVWEKYRKLHNAQGLGVEGIFHIHENDEVEMTGYLVTQAFDYLEKTGDQAFLHKIFPMLEWAWDVQTKHLVRYMLPFNGDETYIAGALLPRSAINDGSAESTLLFITGGEKLLDWIKTNGKWPESKLKTAGKLLAQTKSHYRENFWRQGKLITNNPERVAAAALPRFRHGVCEATGAVNFGWTEKNANNHYVSPFATQGRSLPPAPKKVYDLKVANLLPLYIHTTLIPKNDLAGAIASIANGYKATSRLPSAPQGPITTGFDYGLLLYNLVEIDHPLAGYVYEKMLSLLDSTGAWVERYRNGRPDGCMCRPWESGINLEAAIHFSQNWLPAEKISP